MNEEAQRTLERIAAQKAKRAEDNQRLTRHAEDVDAQLQTQEIIVRSFSTLVDYLDNKVTKTAVINQLKEIGTPDALKVVDAVNALHQTIENQEQVDLTETNGFLRSAVEELQKVPKSVESIDIPDPIDNTKQLKSLETAIKAVDKSIKAQKLVAEAPIVNVPKTTVNVDAPDLDPIKKEQEKTRKELVKAVKGIVFPTTDLSKLEKEAKAHTKLLKDIRDVSGGGGSDGGMSIAPFLNSNDELPVDSDPLAKYKIADVDDSSDPKYYGFTRADGAWYILKEDTTGSPKTYRYVKGADSYDFSNRASETYGYFHTVF